MQNEPTNESRVKEHAKLFTVDGRQVLVHLQRDSDDALVMIFQVWVAQSDEQLRAEISFGGADSIAEGVFADINDEHIPLMLRESGLSAVLEEAEA